MRVGPALVAASLAVIAIAGAVLGPAPLPGALDWTGMGLLQFSYAALLALSIWLIAGRSRNIPYVFWLGLGCAAVAVWNLATGIHDSRMRGEANRVIATFRDAPLNLSGLAEAVERNPYIEAYMIMRDTHWDLQIRLDEHMAGYRAAYGSYVENGQFLDIRRLESRYELWRTHGQVADLEKQLAAAEKAPFETGDLRWAIRLLSVDSRTRDGYADDLDKAIQAAGDWKAAFIEQEKRTLARIKRSLQVVIDAKGRYRFADSRIVFENPDDALRFAGKKPNTD